MHVPECVCAGASTLGAPCRQGLHVGGPVRKGCDEKPVSPPLFKVLRDTDRSNGLGSGQCLNRRRGPLMPLFLWINSIARLPQKIGKTTRFRLRFSHFSGKCHAGASLPRLLTYQRHRPTQGRKSITPLEIMCGISNPEVSVY
jgi:hypothetical protein